MCLHQLFIATHVSPDEQGQSGELPCVRLQMLRQATRREAAREVLSRAEEIEGRKRNTQRTSAVSPPWTPISITSDPGGSRAVKSAGG